MCIRLGGGSCALVPPPSPPPTPLHRQRVFDPSSRALATHWQLTPWRPEPDIGCAISVSSPALARPVRLCVRRSGGGPSDNSNILAGGLLIVWHRMCAGAHRVRNVRRCPPRHHNPATKTHASVLCFCVLGNLQCTHVSERAPARSCRADTHRTHAMDSSARRSRVGSLHRVARHHHNSCLHLAGRVGRCAMRDAFAPVVCSA